MSYKLYKYIIYNIYSLHIQMLNSHIFMYTHSIYADVITHLFHVVYGDVYFADIVWFVLSGEAAFQLPTAVVYHAQHLQKNILIT